MYFWITILAVGFLTYAMRCSFILFRSKKEFPPLVEDFLDYVPVSAMIAIASAHIIYSKLGGELIIDPQQILASIVAAVIGYTTKNLFLTLAFGMGSLWIIQYFV